MGVGVGVGLTQIPLAQRFVGAVHVLVVQLWLKLTGLQLVEPELSVVYVHDWEPLPLLQVLELALQLLQFGLFVQLGGGGGRKPPPPLHVQLCSQAGKIRETPG